MAKNTNENPAILIIIPFYNRLELLFEAIESIDCQSFKDFEVLLIDDGSDAKNIILLKEKLGFYDSRFKLLFKPRGFKKGANTSRAYGFEMAKGTVVKWFDSDDIMLPRFLEVQYKAIIKYKLDGVISNGGVYNKDFSVRLKSSWRRKIYSTTPLKDYLKTQLAWPTPAGMWRKEAISLLNPFDQDLKNGQEWVFYLFILTSNLRVGVLEEELFKIRSHTDSIGANKSQEYFINRMKARAIALGHLVETRNRGKNYLLRSLFMMFRKLNSKNYLRAFGEILRSIKIKDFRKTATVQLILLDIKT